MGSVVIVVMFLVEESCDVMMVFGEGRVKSVNSDVVELEWIFWFFYDCGIL